MFTQLSAHAFIGAIFSASVGASVAVAQCSSPAWSTDFGFPGLTESVVYSSLVFDDGSGPALYLGGQFHYGPGGIAPSYNDAQFMSVVKWDGTAWTPVGSGLYNYGFGGTGDLVQPIYALASYQGQLYAAGTFNKANPSVPTQLSNYLAVFNGFDWQPVGTGLPFSNDTTLNGGVDYRVQPTDHSGVIALQVFDDGVSGQQLYFCGNFKYILDQSNNLIEVDGVARWNGSTLSPVGAQGTHPVEIGRSLIVFDEDGPGPKQPALFMGVENSGVWKWNGSTWSQVVGTNPMQISNVTAMTTFDPDGNGMQLYAVQGGINGFGQQIRSNVDGGGSLIRWNGTYWSTVDVGLDTSCSDRIDGITTATVGGSTQLYVAAHRPSAAGCTGPAFSEPTNGLFFSYDGTSVHSVSPHAITLSYGTQVNDNLYGYQPIQRLMTMASPIGGKQGVLVMGSSVHQFAGADGQSCTGICLWDGTQFSALWGSHGIATHSNSIAEYPALIDGTINAACAFNDNPAEPNHYSLYMAGFGGFGGIAPNPWVAKYDGVRWTTVGTPPIELFPASGSAFQYATYPGYVRVFDTASGPQLFTVGAHIADYNYPNNPGNTELIAQLVGNTWTIVPAPVGIPRNASSGLWVAVDDDGNAATPPLVYHLNNADPYNLAKVVQLVNGQFQALPLPVWSDGVTQVWVSTLAAFDDTGTGHQRLYAVGSPGTYGAALFRYNASTATWTQIGPALNNFVEDILPVSDSLGLGLVVVGPFTQSVEASPVTLNYAARWNGSAWTPMGAGLPSYVSPHGYPAGFLTLWNNMPITGVANPSTDAFALYYFDGSSWSTLNQLGGGFRGMTYYPGVPYLAPIVCDDGGGPGTLYVTGNFYSVDGVPSQGIARYGCSIPTVCCRGTTCNTAVGQGACVASGRAGATSAAAGSCNTNGVATSPCCYADYNKSGSITIQDIFDFLSDWFAKSPYAAFGGDGTSVPTVQSIFSFLAAWFNKGC